MTQTPTVCRTPRGAVRFASLTQVMGLQEFNPLNDANDANDAKSRALPPQAVAAGQSIVPVVRSAVSRRRWAGLTRARVPERSGPEMGCDPFGTEPKIVHFNRAPVWVTPSGPVPAILLTRRASEGPGDPRWRVGLVFPERHPVLNHAQNSANECQKVPLFWRWLTRRKS
jgi:hypothetical protein